MYDHARSQEFCSGQANPNAKQTYVGFRHTPAKRPPPTGKFGNFEAV